MWQILVDGVKGVVNQSSVTGHGVSIIESHLQPLSDDGDGVTYITISLSFSSRGFRFCDTFACLSLTF